MCSEDLCPNTEMQVSKMLMQYVSYILMVCVPVEQTDCFR